MESSSVWDEYQISLCQPRGMFEVTQHEKSPPSTRLGKDGISSAESGQYFITLFGRSPHATRLARE